MKTVTIPTLYVRFTKMGCFVTGHVAKVNAKIGDDTQGWRYVAVMKYGRAFYPMGYNANIGELNSCKIISEKEYNEDTTDMSDAMEFYPN